MRILLLNYEFPPLGGGAGNAAYFLLKEFSKKDNLQIDLITSSAGKYKKEKFSLNINIYYLNIGKSPKKLHYQSTKDLLVYAWKAYFKAKQLAKENNYDLVHTFFGTPCGFIALFLGKPYIVSLRGSDVPFFNSRFYWQDKILFKKLSRLIWKKAKFTVAASQGLKKLALKNAPKQKIGIIYNGADIKLFKPDNKIKKKKVILFVGRLIKRKGINYLLQAFAESGKKVKDNYQIWLVGDGPEKTNLINLCKELEIYRKVKFLGIKNKKQLIDIYNQAKILVLPSLNEGMSNVLLEAIACGLPVIATDVGGSKEIIKGNGFIAPVGNSFALKTILEKYASSEKLILNHSKKSLKRSRYFSWQKSAKNYLKIYQKIYAGQK